VEAGRQSDNKTQDFVSRDFSVHGFSPLQRAILITRIISPFIVTAPVVPPIDDSLVLKSKC
ncbi:MAG TPA: hypothetical protein VIM41_06630, partial [Gammaproteobacteria bacterium]